MDIHVEPIVELPTIDLSIFYALDFNITYQGILRAKAFLCSEHAKELRAWEERWDPNFAWTGSSACGSPGYTLSWVDKGYEVVDAMCPLCPCYRVGTEEFIFFIR